MSVSIEQKDADEVLFTHGPISPEEPQTQNEELDKANALEGVFHGMTLPNEEDVPVGEPGCQHCEVLPMPMRGPGTVLLRFSHTYTLGKVLEFLACSPYPHREHGGTLSIEVGVGSLAPLLSPILDRLSSPEQRDARAQFQPAGVLPQLDDLQHIEALPDFVGRARSDWLLDILRGHKLYSVFQPILRASAPGGGRPDVYGYECLLRANLEDQVVSPGPMLDMARGAGLVFQLDLAARRSALTGAAAQHITEKVFINFSPNAIYNPYTCLDSTVRMVDELGFKREQIVFEIIESERLPELAHLQRIVGYYRENGFGVALDDLGGGFSSLSLLIALRPDYVKLDKSLIQNVDTDETKALIARKLLEVAQELGLSAVAEGIERPEEWDWVQRHGAEFVQGYLFARPGSPPPLRAV